MIEEFEALLRQLEELSYKKYDGYGYSTGVLHSLLIGLASGDTVKDATITLKSLINQLTEKTI